MDETFAALDAKMTPKEIGLELWSLFKGGSSTGASKLWQVAKEHPMPAAVVGLGLGWLLVESSRKSDGYRRPLPAATSATTGATAVSDYPSGVRQRTSSRRGSGCLRPPRTR